MSGYIGKVQIGTSESNRLLVGSTLYGVCNTSISTTAKEVTLADFNALMPGITVHVKFTQGNSATNNLTLKVNNTAAIAIAGNCICKPDDVISFTLDGLNSQGTVDESTANWRWRANSSASFATRDYVDGLMGAADAMTFKGTLGTNGTITTIPATNYSIGDTYRVTTPGTYAGEVCEEGDLITAISNPEANQSSAVAAHWIVIQGNLDGTVTGPSSSVNNHIAIFDGTNGKILKDTGFTIQTSVPENAVFTDHQYELIKGAQAYTGSAADDSEGTVLVEVENGVLQLSPYIKFTTAAVGTSLGDPTQNNP